MSNSARSATLVAVACLLGIVVGQRPSPPALAHGTARFAAIVTLTGADLETALKGAKQESLFGYVHDDGEWLRLPVQLDEKDAQGNYVAAEDGGFDADDEIVLPMEHAGGKRPAGGLPADVSGVSGVVEVKVVDPLDASFMSYVYVLRARSGPAQENAPVSFDSATSELKSRAYRLGFADPIVDEFVGIKHLSLYASSRNLLDRLKMRFTASFLGQTSVINEADLAGFASQIPGLVPNPVKMGPVRGVIAATGGFAYADRVDLVGGVPGGLPAGGVGGGIAISAARLSLDFSPAAAGATYLDANLKEPVTIDGKPDAVPSGPIPGWREYAFTEGRAILLAEVQPAVSVSATVYYKDDKTVVSDDTGDFQSWGDSGVAAASIEGLAAAGFPGEMVVLPEGRSLTAANLLAQKLNPLQATWTVEVLDVGTEPPTAAPTVRATTPPPATRPVEFRKVLLPAVLQVHDAGS